MQGVGVDGGGGGFSGVQYNQIVTSFRGVPCSTFCSYEPASLTGESSLASSHGAISLPLGCHLLSPGLDSATPCRCVTPLLLHDCDLPCGVAQGVSGLSIIHLGRYRFQSLLQACPMKHVTGFISDPSALCCLSLSMRSAGWSCHQMADEELGPTQPRDTNP
jgi:hypothetical protein